MICRVMVMLELRAAHVAEELDVQPVAVAPVAGPAHLQHHLPALRAWRGRTLRHEEDFAVAPAAQPRENPVDFLEIMFTSDDKLELALWIAVDEALKNVEIEPPRFVAAEPRTMLRPRRGVRQLRTDRHEVAVDIPEDRACGLDRDVQAVRSGISPANRLQYRAE